MNITNDFSILRNLWHYLIVSIRNRTIKSIAQTTMRTDGHSIANEIIFDGITCPLRGYTDVELPTQKSHSNIFFFFLFSFPRMFRFVYGLHIILWVQLSIDFRATTNWRNRRVLSFTFNNMATVLFFHLGNWNHRRHTKIRHIQRAFFFLFFQRRKRCRSKVVSKKSIITLLKNVFVYCLILRVISFFFAIRFVAV